MQATSQHFPGSKVSVHKPFPPGYEIFPNALNRALFPVTRSFFSV